MACIEIILFKGCKWIEPGVIVQWLRNIFLFTIFRLSSIWWAVAFHYCLHDFIKRMLQPKHVMIYLIGNTVIYIQLYMYKWSSLSAYKRYFSHGFDFGATSCHQQKHTTLGSSIFNCNPKCAHWLSQVVHDAGRNLVH